MNWSLIEATDVDCTMDDSGVYTIISRIKPHPSRNTADVRADLMQTDGDVPLISFIGTANNVRKRLIAWLSAIGYGRRWISREHASYIGYELHRAESDADYVQD